MFRRVGRRQSVARAVPSTRLPRLDRIVALGVVAATVVGATQSIRATSQPRWRTCDDAVEIVDQRLPAPPGEVRGANRAAHILGRIWASRPELHDTLSTKGQPNIAALAGWSAGLPDVSSLPVASCVDDLAKLVDPSLSLATMRSLASLLSWTQERSRGSFFELEANRNAAFELVAAARPSLLADQDPAIVVTGQEIITWAWNLPIDDPSFDPAWKAVDELSIAE